MISLILTKHKQPRTIVIINSYHQLMVSENEFLKTNVTSFSKLSNVFYFSFKKTRRLNFFFRTSDKVVPYCWTTNRNSKSTFA